MEREASALAAGGRAARSRPGRGESVRKPASPPPSCGGCGLALRWEQIAGDAPERWLAICSCGMPWAFLPGRPDHAPDDALTAALGVGRRRAGGSPPWIRVFQLSSGYPWWLHWRHVARGCPGCAQRVRFAVWTRPRRDRCAYLTLCLACGRATSEYVCTTNRDMSEAPLSGSQWSPPCVAVARLRRAVFAAPWAG
jgi:hypothetical protein